MLNQKNMRETVRNWKMHSSTYLNKTREISNKNISLVTNVIMALGDYLLGRGNFPKEVETHLYFINNLAFINHADLYPITFLKEVYLGLY